MGILGNFRGNFRHKVSISSFTYIAKQIYIIKALFLSFHFFYNYLIFIFADISNAVLNKLVTFNEDGFL